MMKRQRVDDGVEQPIAASHPPGSKPSSKAKEEVGLPAELWSHVLQYAYFDELLTCTAVNKFFHDEVPLKLKVLHVRSGDSMDVAPAAIATFSRVQSVHIYLISDLTHGITKWHLDCVAIQNAVPFLANLPKLELCSLGHLTERGWDSDYNVAKESDYDEPNSNEKWASLIQAVCAAYKMGKLASTVQFDGLIPYNERLINDECAWKLISTIDTYRDDVPCQICDMICTSFPPMQVLERSQHEFIPCISFKNMCRIVKYRDLIQAPNIMIRAFLKEVEDDQGQCLMCPPDYVTKTCDALVYYDHHIARMREYIANGANPKHPEVLRHLADKERVEMLHSCDPDHPRFIGRKRIIELETYTRLKDIGFDVGLDDFITVDQSDKRTSWQQFDVRRVVNQLSSGVAVGDIEDIRCRVMRMVDRHRPGRGRFRDDNNAVVVDVNIMLEEWLEVDLQKYRNDINSLIRECQQARDNQS